MKSLEKLSLILLIGGLTLTSCKKEGCTDETAENYNEKAKKDDGSCTYATPTIGDESIASPTFTTNALLASSKSQEFPQLVLSGSNSGVLWAESPSPCELKFVGLTSSYAADGAAGTAVDNTGTISSATDVDANLVYSSSASKYMTAYVHAQSSDYGLKGKVFTPSDMTEGVFDIEGPFNYANERPRYPKMDANGSGTIGVVYHSSSGTSTPSSILFKTVDVSGSSPVVSPAAESTQTGIELSVGDSDALFPDIAWNTSAGVFGVVYMVGSGNGRSIKFVTVDASGTIVTSAKTLIPADGLEVQQPRIVADGSGFAITWRDFRKVQIGNAEPITGIPAIRFARCDANGNLTSASGATDIFDASDNSLLISNPYMNEVSLYHDLVVKTPGSVYGLIWATQTSPYEVYFSEVRVSGSTVSASVESKISGSASSDRVGIASDGSKYIITYTAAKSGSGYETILGQSN